MNRFSILSVALSLFVGCATAPPPPLTGDNPASPLAPEATVRPLRNALASDDLTRKTQQIFAQAQNQEGQPSPTPQSQQMPGMKMP